jgi:hypothetical protein
VISLWGGIFEKCVKTYLRREGVSKPAISRPRSYLDEPTRSKKKSIFRSKFFFFAI